MCENQTCEQIKKQMEDGVGVGDDGVVKNGIDIIYALTTSGVNAVSLVGSTVLASCVIR